MTLDQAYRLRSIIETAMAGVDDATASQAPTLFPGLKGDGSLIAAGTRVNWGGAVKRAAADLWDTPENAPDAAPDLWEDILYRDGIRVIPETITAGGAFARDELGWWGDTLMCSTVDANVWTPEQYPGNWEAVNT